MVIYDIQNLVKAYPGQAKKANNNISLQIHEGEIFGILGDNGAGKTTLVRQLVNLLVQDSGKISFFGKDLSLVKERLQINVGYMPQNGGVLNNLTVEEALYFTSYLRGMNAKAARKECNFLLELWQIQSLRHQPSSLLSGGQQRLLRLAISMAGSPPVLILDEPTNDLDPLRRKLVWDILKDVNQRSGTTIILITHDAIEAEKAIQRVGILRAGELVAVGRPVDLKKQIDQMIRIEIFFTPEIPPNLPDNLKYISLGSGHWQILLEWNQLHSIIDLLKSAKIDGFRLYSSTLEDLYIHFMEKNLDPAEL